MSIDKEIINQGIVKDIVKAIKSVRFGYVQIIIQDSKVIQIDKTEKLRLDNQAKKGGDEAGKMRKGGKNGENL